MTIVKVPPPPRGQTHSGEAVDLRAKSPYIGGWRVRSLVLLYLAGVIVGMIFSIPGCAILAH